MRNVHLKPEEGDVNSRNFLISAAVGSAATLLFDPTTGRRRRALIGDKLVHAGRVTRNRLGTATGDISNRARGLTAAARHRASDDQVDDATIAGRVRARLGRACSHPRAVDVFVWNGSVTLRGLILAAEVTDVVEAVTAVPGVTNVINELEPHVDSDGIPSLQGNGRRTGWNLSPRRWSPITRTLVGAGIVAGVIAARRSRRRSDEISYADAF